MTVSVTTLTHEAFKQHLKQHPTFYTYYLTDAGILQVCSTYLGIYETSFISKHNAPSDYQKYLVPTNKSLSVILVGTLFQIKVWQAALDIPQGYTTHYQQIAHMIGCPHAWRAVANALARNKIAYFIPCHRVLRKNGMPGGYRWGIEKKRALLKTESFLA